MRSGQQSLTLTTIALFSLTLLLLVACAPPPATPVPADLSAGVREGPSAPAVDQANISDPISTAASPAPQVDPLPSGPELLRSQCARCHLPALLEQIEKPRTEWEEILERMAGQGVQLSASEKDILLEYLTAAG